MLVYDVTKRETFISLRHWLDEIQLNAEETIEKILVGNKCDMTHARVSILCIRRVLKLVM